MIQPGTNKLVYKADVSLYTRGDRPVRISEGLTGLSGEPFDAGAEGTLDPSFGRLLVIARKYGMTGSMEISYDRDRRYWKQAYDPVRQLWTRDHDRGDWRPQVVYQYDEGAGDWKEVAYSVWKERLDAVEKSRIELLERQFTDDLEEELADAVARGMIDASRQSQMVAAFRSLIEADLKALDDADLKARVAAACAPPIDPGVEGRINELFNGLIVDERTGAPEPPVVRIPLPRAFRIPARTYRHLLPTAQCVIVPR